MIKIKLMFKVLLAVLSICSVAFQSNAQAVEKSTHNLEDTASTLQNLTQYEIDYAFILAQASDNLNNKALREKVAGLKQETEENIKELASLVRNYGREVPAYSRDFKGFFMQGYAAMRGLLSDKGVMKALHTNSQMILKAFDNAINANLPIDVKNKIRKMHEAKRKHIEYFASQMQ